MKKIIALLLACLMVLALFCACGEQPQDEQKPEDQQGEKNPTDDTPDDQPEAKELKVGAILIGDETEGYTLAHMNGMEDAIAKLKEEGKTVTLDYKKKIPEDASVATNANQLIAGGCNVIITNSYGHQFNFDTVVESNPEVTFVSMTGDLAAGTGLANYKNAFTKVFESRYVSGVVAGLKLKALLDSGELTPEAHPECYDGENIKIGYVGAFNYAEVVSGYTAFFLGLKSQVSNVVMTVKYTNSWFSEEREAAVGEFLMNQGCVIIGQHADSTGAPAAVQKARTNGTNTITYSVGYNVSMTDVAPDVALTSAGNIWSAYYYELFNNLIEGKEVPTDWAKGYADEAVCITDLGKNCAEGTQAVVDSTVAAIKDGSLKVFDVSKFTVGGANLTTYTDAYGMNGAEALVTENGVTYFDESSLRSAPYFDIRIDGITEVASDYAD